MFPFIEFIIDCSFLTLGMFDTSNNMEHSLGISQSQDGRLDRRKSDFKGVVPTGVVGVAVRSTADMSSYSSEALDDDDDVRTFTLTFFPDLIVK